MGDAYADKWLRMQQVHIFPWIGKLPIAEIPTTLVLDTLRRVEKQGKNETAHSLRQYAGQTFRYAIATKVQPPDLAHHVHGDHSWKPRCLNLQQVS